MFALLDRMPYHLGTESGNLVSSICDVIKLRVTEAHTYWENYVEIGKEYRRKKKYWEEQKKSVIVSNLDACVIMLYEHKKKSLIKWIRWIQLNKWHPSTNRKRDSFCHLILYWMLLHIPLFVSVFDNVNFIDRTIGISPNLNAFAGEIFS